MSLTGQAIALSIKFCFSCFSSFPFAYRPSKVSPAISSFICAQGLRICMCLLLVICVRSEAQRVFKIDAVQSTYTHEVMAQSRHNLKDSLCRCAAAVLGLQVIFRALTLHSSLSGPICTYDRS